MPLVSTVAFGSDIQMWNELDLTAAFGRVQLTAPLVVRNSFQLANPQIAAGGILAEVSLEKWISLSGGYLLAGLPNTGKGYTSNIPLLAMTLKHSLGRLQLSDRNRAEKLYGLPNSPVRYRNKVSASIPLGGGRWVPFVTNETFYDFSKSGWTQNRFQAGISHPLTARLRLDAFFLERSDLRSSANSVHAIGLTLSIDLKPKKHQENSL
jgi:hypothetical protein